MHKLVDFKGSCARSFNENSPNNQNKLEILHSKNVVTLY